MADSRSLYLGVDGGNSGTRALVADAAARVLGYGFGGNANHQGQGIEQAMGNIEAAVHGACAEAGVAIDSLSGAFFALAGDDTDDDDAVLVPALSARWPGLRFGLGNDVWAGLRAGARDGCGIAVNCGTGTGAVGRAASGEKAIIPDLGYVFGDSGGGGQIAFDALRAVSRAADGRGQPTALTALLLRLTGQPSVEALRRELYHHRITRDMFPSITRAVFEAAAGGDNVAAGILHKIGEELGVSCVAIARCLHMQDEPFTLVLTGGTFRSLQSPLAIATIERAHEEAPYCVPVLPLVMPAAGAVLLALDTAGQAVSNTHYSALCDQGFGWHAEEVFATGE